jgi:hypothetical protein
VSTPNKAAPIETAPIRIVPYDAAVLRAMGRATAYDPLPTEPDEQRLPYTLIVADNKPTQQPQPTTKPAYEPLPTEVDTRENKPGKQK